MKIKAYISEIIGTFTLVFFGCGSAVFAGNLIGNAGISIAFGLTIVACAYSLGQFSGVHLNPAVTIGALVAKRIEAKEAVGYIISQCVGALLASTVIGIIGASMGVSGFGENLYTDSGIAAAFTFEFVATFIFLIVILGVTSKKGNATFAGLTIGGALTMIHLVGIPITGTSVNPARSLAPALFAGGDALAQLWLFILAPILGAVAAGAVFHYFFEDGQAE